MQGFAAWTVFATFTFGDDVSEAFALNVLRAWRTTIANGEHMPIAFTWEPQACGRPHFHVLIALTGEQTYRDETSEQLCARVVRAWHAQHHTCGRSTAVPFDASKGAAWYGPAMHEHWDVDIDCPRRPVCRRRNGCVERRKRDTGRRERSAERND